MAPEVVAVFARWWDNFQESCDIRLAVGCGCAVAWVLLVAISPVISTTSTFIEGGLTWRSGIVIGSLLAFAAAATSCRRRACPRWDGGRAPAIPLLAAAAVLSPVGAVLHQSIAGGVLAVLAGLFVGSGLGALVLTVYLVKRSRIESPRAAFRPATILIAAGIALLPFVGDAGAIPCMAVAFAGFGCFLVYFWIVMGNMAQRWNTTPLPLCAFGFLLLLSGIAFGELAAWILYRLPVDFGYPAAVSVVSLFLLVMLAWNMTDGSRYAQETAAMGGIPFGSENRGLGFGDTGDELEPGAPAAVTDAKLRAAAETYGLSPREVEVVALLLRGRSIPYICDELFIAKSTAQTHVRHIYAKMNITGGRQELIDRLESAECS